MSIFGFRKTQMVSAEDALPGRATPMPVPARHEVLHTPLQGPYPEGSEIAEFALGCFWGEERTFWQVPGVYTTAVGYEGGFTPNPPTRRSAPGRTGPRGDRPGRVRPGKVSYQQLLKVFWESHDPTQGMRQGNDTGTQYRSAIFYHERGAAGRRRAVGGRVPASGCASAATARSRRRSSRPGEFYFAEDYHQQYLYKVPHGYCPDHSTGVSCPVGGLELASRPGGAGLGTSR